MGAGQPASLRRTRRRTGRGNNVSGRLVGCVRLTTVHSTGAASRFNRNICAGHHIARQDLLLGFSACRAMSVAAPACGEMTMAAVQYHLQPSGWSVVTEFTYTGVPAALPSTPHVAATESAGFSIGATFGWAALALALKVALIRLVGPLLNSSNDWLKSELLGLLASLLAVLMLGLVIKRGGSCFRDYMGLARPKFRAVMIGVLAAITLHLLALAYMAAQVMSAHGRLPHLQIAPREVLADINVWCWIFGLVVVTPVFEELTFRGFVFGGLVRRMDPAFALMLISLVFSLLHLDGALLWHLLGSTLYGALRWRTNTIWPSIAAHATNNLLASIFIEFVKLG
jgi:membrane protease YdiL (CAAX protease family)